MRNCNGELGRGLHGESIRCFGELKWVRGAWEALEVRAVGKCLFARSIE